jgi:hypothetical protein
MIDPIKSNLEPINDDDLNLEKHLKHDNVLDASVVEKVPYVVEKEAGKEIIGAERDSAYGNILSKIQTHAQSITDPNSVASDAHAASQKTDADAQVQHLVDVAMQKGVVHAVKVAQHLEDNYVLDTLHDKLLANELHDALVQKGLLKEI